MAYKKIRSSISECHYVPVLRWLICVADIKMSETSTIRQSRRNQRRLLQLEFTKQQKQIATTFLKNGLDQAGFTVKKINDVIGHGVFATNPFKKGEFLMEYRGELISYREALRREVKYEKRNLGSFLFFFKLDGKRMCVDATYAVMTKGRMINDSPTGDLIQNCQMKVIYFDEKPRLCIWATRDIQIGEELRYDYGVPNLPWRKKIKQNTNISTKKISSQDVPISQIGYQAALLDTVPQSVEPHEDEPHDDKNQQKHQDVPIGQIGYHAGVLDTVPQSVEPHEDEPHDYENQQRHQDLPMCQTGYQADVSDTVPQCVESHNDESPDDENQQRHQDVPIGQTCYQAGVLDTVPQSVESYEDEPHDYENQQRHQDVPNGQTGYQADVSDTVPQCVNLHDAEPQDDENQQRHQDVPICQTGYHADVSDTVPQCVELHDDETHDNENQERHQDLPIGQTGYQADVSDTVLQCVESPDDEPHYDENQQRRQDLPIGYQADVSDTVPQCVESPDDDLHAYENQQRQQDVPNGQTGYHADVSETVPQCVALHDDEPHDNENQQRHQDLPIGYQADVSTTVPQCVESPDDDLHAYENQQRQQDVPNGQTGNHADVPETVPQCVELHDDEPHDNENQQRHQDLPIGQTGYQADVSDTVPQCVESPDDDPNNDENQLRPHDVPIGRTCNQAVVSDTVPQSVEPHEDEPHAYENQQRQQDLPIGYQTDVSDTVPQCVESPDNEPHYDENQQRRQDLPIGKTGNQADVSDTVPQCVESPDDEPHEYENQQRHQQLDTDSESSDESDVSDIHPMKRKAEKMTTLMQKFNKLELKYKKMKQAIKAYKEARTEDGVITSQEKSNSASDGQERVQGNKKLACYFCEKLFSHRITEHWDHCHRNEMDVSRIQATSDKSKKQTLIQRLRNLGNFKHNIKLLQGGGDREKIISVRQIKNSKNEDFLPCTTCYGFYLKKHLWRHVKECPFNTEKNVCGKNVQAAAHLMIKAAVLPDSDGNDNDILDKIGTRHDDVGLNITRDVVILKMANVLLKKLGTRRKNDISSRIRQLARLKIELNKIKNEQNDLKDMLCGKKFDDVVAAVHNLAGLYENEENVNRFQKPGLALRIGHNLVKAAEIKVGMSIREDDEVGLKESESFLKLLKSEWKDSVTSIALTSLKCNKFNKGEVLPLTEDLVKLKKYLSSRMQYLLLQLNSFDSWRELAEVTLARILLFNKRRSAETAKLLMSSFHNRPNWKETTNLEIYNSLSEMEKKMFDRMDMIQSQGKRDKKVATLLTDDMVKAIEMLIRSRTSCGIKETNKYIFANQENGHLLAWPILKKVAVLAGCQKPQLINSVSLRKYIATVSQVLDLNQGEVQWLSNHLSHTVKTHSEFYRMQEAAVEIGKVSKLLMLTEDGNVANFQGKSLEDIQIDDTVAFDTGEKEEIDIGEDDPLDTELIQDDLAFDMDDENSDETGSFREDNWSTQDHVNDGIKRKLTKPSSTQSYLEHVRHGIKRRMPKPSFSTCPSDEDLDDSDHDPDFKSTSSESESEQPPIKRKKRWSSEEKTIFKCLFKNYISEKRLPPGKVIKNSTKHIKSRSVLQIRTRIHNIISGKQSFE